MEPLPIIVKEGSVLRAAGIAIVAAGIGLCIMLACLGVSFFITRDDHPVLKRLDILTTRIEELAQRPDRTDEVVAKVDNLDRNASKIGSNITNHLTSVEGSLEELKRRPIISGNPDKHEKTNGNVIEREVTVFHKVPHDNGSTVMTGWIYADGASADQPPKNQFCYWSSERLGGTTAQTTIWLANEGKRMQNIGAGVPQLEDALQKCIWWNASSTEIK